MPPPKVTSRISPRGAFSGSIALDGPAGSPRFALVQADGDRIPLVLDEDTVAKFKHALPNQNYSYLNCTVNGEFVCDEQGARLVVESYELGALQKPKRPATVQGYTMQQLYYAGYRPGWPNSAGDPRHAFGRLRRGRC